MNELGGKWIETVEIWACVVEWRVFTLAVVGVAQSSGQPKHAQIGISRETSYVSSYSHES